MAHAGDWLELQQWKRWKIVGFEILFKVEPTDSADELELQWGKMRVQVI